MRRLESVGGLAVGRVKEWGEILSGLEGINKSYHTEIIIDYFTCKNSRHEFAVRELDQIQVKGRTEGSRI